MDLLYARYSNPMDLMGRYINQGRFGEFVHEFLTDPRWAWFDSVRNTERYQEAVAWAKVEAEKEEKNK